jgi:hypothetical protein
MKSRVLGLLAGVLASMCLGKEDLPPNSLVISGKINFILKYGILVKAYIVYATLISV